MVKCEAIKDFSLEEFSKLKNIIRKNVDKYGWLYKGDIFECDEDMAKYLNGENQRKEVVIKILEVIPEEPATEQVNEQVKKETKTKKTARTRKTRKKVQE